MATRNAAQLNFSRSAFAVAAPMTYTGAGMGSRSVPPPGAITAAIRVPDNARAGIDEVIRYAGELQKIAGDKLDWALRAENEPTAAALESGVNLVMNALISQRTATRYMFIINAASGFTPVAYNGPDTIEYDQVIIQSGAVEELAEGTAGPITGFTAVKGQSTVVRIGGGVRMHLPALLAVDGPQYLTEFIDSLVDAVMRTICHRCFEAILRVPTDLSLFDLTPSRIGDKFRDRTPADTKQHENALMLIVQKDPRAFANLVERFKAAKTTSQESPSMLMVGPATHRFLASAPDYQLYLQTGRQQSQLSVSTDWKEPDPNNMFPVARISGISVYVVPTTRDPTNPDKDAAPMAGMLTTGLFAIIGADDVLHNRAYFVDPDRMIDLERSKYKDNESWEYANGNVIRTEGIPQNRIALLVSPGVGVATEHASAIVPGQLGKVYIKEFVTTLGTNPKTQEFAGTTTIKFGPSVQNPGCVRNLPHICATSYLGGHKGEVAEDATVLRRKDDYSGADSFLVVLPEGTKVDDIPTTFAWATEEMSGLTAAQQEVATAVHAVLKHVLGEWKRASPFADTIYITRMDIPKKAPVKYTDVAGVLTVSEWAVRYDSICAEGPFGSNLGPGAKKYLNAQVTGCY